MLKVGLAEQLFRTRYSPTALVRASYLTAVATGMDSFWLPDHLNALLPRSIATTQYLGAAGSRRIRAVHENSSPTSQAVTTRLSRRNTNTDGRTK